MAASGAVPPTIYRSPSNTVMALCSTSFGPICPCSSRQPALRPLRAAPRTRGGELHALAASGEARLGVRGLGGSGLAAQLSAYAGSNTAHGGPAGHRGRRQVAVCSASVRTSTGSGGSRSGSLDEEVAPQGAATPAAPSSGILRNGTAPNNGSSSSSSSGPAVDAPYANGSSTGAHGDSPGSSHHYTNNGSSSSLASHDAPAGGSHSVSTANAYTTDPSGAVNGAAPPAAASPAAHAAPPAPPPPLFADLEDAKPYRNGNGTVTASARNGAAAGAAAGNGSGYADSGGNGKTEEVCVVELDTDGEFTTRCMPLGGDSMPMPTVASVMQPAPSTIDVPSSSAAVSSNGAGGGGAGAVTANTGLVSDAILQPVIRPSGFRFADDGDFGGKGGMAGMGLVVEDVQPTVSMDMFGIDPESGRGRGKHHPSGSVDMQDTPEGLADVELSTVAPNADWFKNQDDITTLTYAVLTGGVVALAVFVFDVSIQYIHDLPDIFSQGLGIGGGRKAGLELLGTSIPFRCVMPVMAGFVVAWLQSQGFAPALKVLTRAMEGVTDDASKASTPKSFWQVVRKATASAVTLGSGASLGPEAPSVELGANTAAVLAPKNLSKRRQRMLIAAGAAAGVSAAFDAPVSGALFAVEFVLKSSRLGLDRLSTSTVFVSTSVAAGVIGFLRAEGQALGIAGAGTHLVGRIPYFSIQPNLLVDVLQFSALGLGCSVAAVALYEGVRVSEIALRPLPRWLSAPTAGALCGLIAYRFPQVQYGYVNLEEIFRDSTGMSAGDLTALLTAKIVATSVCVGGGLVGGLFAPSLFLGALVGDILGHFVAVPWGIADPTSLVVVGAAAVLGAACRAPLTAIALMVEITRDTGLLVPLLSAIGVASLFTDYLEGIFSKRLEQALIELYLREKAFFWAASLVPLPDTTNTGNDKTVEDVMGTRASMYVRHTVPLAQAKAALIAKGRTAAVVVDDNFSPMGVVYLEDVDAELIRQQLLNEPDANFNRRL